METVCFPFSFSFVRYFLHSSISGHSGKLVSYDFFFLITFLLNLFDQLFCWSRLKIDREGYDLRTWWIRKKFAHYEIKSFELGQYMHRKLIVIQLKKSKTRPEHMQRVPFPCSFGRAVDEVLSELNDSLEKRPYKGSPKKLKGFD